MAQAANIVIADALATPVNHTFVPIGPDPKDNTIFWFEDQSQASPIGFWKISLEFKRPKPASAGESSANRTMRAKISLHEPILETLSNSTVSGIVPAPTLSYVPRVFVEFVLPERATLQNRKDLRKMLSLLLNDAQVIAMVESLNIVF